MGDQQVQRMSDAAALDELAAYLREVDQWNGGDFCELGARVVQATGRVLDERPTDGPTDEQRAAAWDHDTGNPRWGLPDIEAPPSTAGLFDVSITAEQLKAAAAWATEGENIATVELLVDDRMLVVSQGDERAAFDTGGEPGSDEYVRRAPLDR